MYALFAYHQIPLRRQTLLDWKSSQVGRKLPTTPKEQFPFLLKTALNALTDWKPNIIAVFRKTRIYPINKEEPLARFLRQERIVNIELKRKKLSGKEKLNLPVGKSICSSDLAEAGPSGVQQIRT